MHGFFYGWYLKCQSDRQTLAVIPVVHERENRCTCSIQIITEEGAWLVPFSFLPFLECRHSVFSMRHAVRGKVEINGQEYNFSDAWGYWEGDQGRSFPREYAWTQCCFEGGSLMLSVADIPLAGFHFTGVICAVLYKGREYRLATYLGAKAVQIHNGKN